MYNPDAGSPLKILFFFNQFFIDFKFKYLKLFYSKINLFL